MSRLLPLLTVLSKELSKIESNSGNQVIKFMNSRFSRLDNHNISDEVFLSAYTHYILSNRRLVDLVGKYAKGERSIKETASIVGLKLPLDN